MTYKPTFAHTHAFVLLTLVVLQEHACALPAPWPLLVDAAVAIAEEHRGTPVKRFGISLPKFSEAPLVGNALADTPLGRQEIGPPQQVAANMGAEELEKQMNKDSKPPAEPKDSNPPAEPAPSQDQPKPADKQPENPKPNDSDKKPEDKKPEESNDNGNDKKPDTNTDKGGSNSLGPGEIAGIVGGVIVLIAIIGGIWYWCRRKRQGEEEDQTS